MRDRIEDALEALGRFCFRRAWAVIATVLAVIALGATQIPNIEVRTSIDEFLDESDETRARYNEFLTEFGRDDMIMLALTAEDVFDLAFLARLRFHDALEEGVPHLLEVQSLINARETRGEQDELIVGEALRGLARDRLGARGDSRSAPSPTPLPRLPPLAATRP